MPMILRFLNVQGIAGLALSLALGVLLVVQKGETRHWRKQSGAFEQLYTQETRALAGTVANYRAAAEQARAADRANVDRVEGEQRAISQRSSNDYQTRIAAARQSAQRQSAAQRLRGQAAVAAVASGSGGAAPVPGLPVASRRVDQGAREDRFSDADRELATEQAIQLDELIKWVRRQHGVDPQGSR